MKFRITQAEKKAVPSRPLGGGVLENSSAEDRLCRAAEPQASASLPCGAERRKILFLGNSYNPVSVACLRALVETGHETTVGFYDPLTPGVWPLLRKSLKSRGWSFVQRKAARMLWSKARIALRRVGVPLSGFVSLQELTRTLGLNVIRCTDPNSAEFVDHVKRLGVDLVVVAGFGRILKNTLIGTPRLGCVNVHSSLLPGYRGPEPFYWVLVNQETTTGVTLHYVDEGIDSGDIILQRDFAILSNDTATTLVDRCAGVAVELLCEAIPLLLAGRAPRIPQNPSSASYYSFPPRGASVRKARTRIHALPAARAGQKACGSLYAIDPLQDQRWRALLDEHPRASVFHTVPWLLALRQTYGYEPIVYTTSPPGGDLRNGIVFCRVKSWVTGRRLVSLPFSDHCEPLIDSAGELESILDYLRADRRTGDWKYVEVRPVNGSLEYSFARRGFQPSKVYYLHTIDLQPQEDQLFRRFHKSSVQQRIRRAEREGLVYECGRSDVLLRKFYQLLLLTRRAHRVPPPPEEWFRNLLACMGDALQLHLASYKSTAVAALITLRFKNIAVYKYGGSDRAYHRLGSVPFLLAKAIWEAKSSGAQVFDLGRSDLDNPGLIEFKSHWASTQTFLTYWRFPAPARKLLMTHSPAVNLAKCVFASLPDSMLKMAGEIFYRHAA